MIEEKKTTRTGRKFIGAALAGALLLTTGCATTNTGGTAGTGGASPYKKTTIGAVGGAATGAVAGALIAGHKHRGAGALIGGLLGAAGGGAIGNYMDRQAKDMQAQLPEAAIAREDDKLYVALPSGILFDVDKTDIMASARDEIARAAQVLVKYPDTYITVEGHTDSTGATEYNQKLSERRADAVRNELLRNGVSASRITIKGYGETDPIADNSTAEGRQANRRVQLEIRPNEKLKAQQG